MKMKTLPIFMAFLVMGVADAMGPLSDAVKEQYNLSSVMATLLSFFVFIAFAAFSVPGGLLAARIGMKKLLLLGLGLNAAAMLVPSVMVPGFALLLFCIFVLGIGTTFLQVAGNPIMREVSAEGAYSRNLSFAQGIKGIGSTAATYLVTAIATIALFDKMGWRGPFPVFFVLMAASFIFVSIVKVHETKPDVPPSIGSSLGLLKQPVFALAVLGIFLYVGAEASMGRFLFPRMRVPFYKTHEVTAAPKDIDAAMAAEKLIIKVKEAEAKLVLVKDNPEELKKAKAVLAKFDSEKIAKAKVNFAKLSPQQFKRAKVAWKQAGKYGATLFFLLLTIGRIVGGAVLLKVKPRPAFRVSALMGVAGAVLLMTTNLVPLAIAGVILSGLGFANIWPLLFSITVEEKPEHAGELSGLMCMAISGGALVPLVMGGLVDAGMKSIAFVIPVACFVYLFILSLKGGKKAAA